MIDPTAGWFEIQQYDDKQSITVANIIEQVVLKISMASTLSIEKANFIFQDSQKMIKED
jgi:hypothetical protein